MKKHTFNFNEQLKKQKQFYDAFVGWVKERSNVMCITEADETEQKLGIDFWAVVIGETQVPIEVKCDFRLHETGNIAVETVGNADYNNWKPGWLFKLYNTHLLTIIDPHTGDFWIIDSQAFYHLVVEYMNMYKAFSARNENEETGTIWYGMGVLVPMRTLHHVIMDKGNIYHFSSGKQMLVTKKRRNEKE